MVGIGLGHADLCLIGSSSRLWHHPANETPLPHKAGNDATYPCRTDKRSQATVFHQHLPRDTYSDVTHHQSFAKTDDKRYRPRTAKELPHHLAQFRKNPAAGKPIDGYTQDRQRTDVTRFP